MNDQTLGNIARICAPALLVEALLTGGEERPLVIGLASTVFMAGWICSNTVPRRAPAAGAGWWGRSAPAAGRDRSGSAWRAWSLWPVGSARTPSCEGRGRRERAGGDAR